MATSGRPAPKRTQVRRVPEKQSHDREQLDSLLDTALIAHLAVISSEQPFVIPMAYVRDQDRLLLHGSNASRLMKSLTAGAATCATITIVDGLVLARSQFESSMHYRSAMIFGQCRAVAGDEKAAAFTLITEGLLPGRSHQARPPNSKEFAATAVLELPITEWSLKVSKNPPEDDPEDIVLDSAGDPIWTGVVPIEHRFGTPQPSADLPADYPIPGYVKDWTNGRT